MSLKVPLTFPLLVRVALYIDSYLFVNAYIYLDVDDLVSAKASYIIDHFVSKSKQLSNEEFVAKGMLVVKGREKIIHVPLHSSHVFFLPLSS